MLLFIQIGNRSNRRWATLAYWRSVCESNTLLCSAMDLQSIPLPSGPPTNSVFSWTPTRPSLSSKVCQEVHVKTEFSAFLRMPSTKEVTDTFVSSFFCFQFHHRISSRNEQGIVSFKELGVFRLHDCNLHRFVVDVNLFVCLNQDLLTHHHTWSLITLSI